jgi:hypothetical protein
MLRCQLLLTHVHQIFTAHAALRLAGIQQHMIFVSGDAEVCCLDVFGSHTVTGCTALLHLQQLLHMHMLVNMIGSPTAALMHSSRLVASLYVS